MPMYETQLKDESFAEVSGGLFVFIWLLYTYFVARLIAT